jgi:serine/threonine-protein kinase HipA
MSEAEEVTVLKLILHDRLIGYLAGYRNGRNVLSFTDEFKHDANRPTFSLITHPNFPNAAKVMSSPWARNQRLPPTLSNLLPEGALRELIAQKLKVHINNEFRILSYLGDDLPGAIVATPADPQEVPDYVLSTHGKVKAVKLIEHDRENTFSLAGVQMKFSMTEKDGRYNLRKGGALGDWIIKTPSTRHRYVPLNEYSAMSLAAMVGVEIPEIKLVELSRLDNLPPINLPDETYAFAIKRFDRLGNIRVHMEDFAQVLVKYPDDKYQAASYEQVARVLYTFSGDALDDIQQYATRLLVNILLANGDAHLKNWSLIYRDRLTPRLSPAYDIVTTSVYIENEQEFALNLARNKNWYEVDYTHFKRWSEKAGIPWRAIKPHLDDTLEKARSLWPNSLEELPMQDEHKAKLKEHWRMLQNDFRIDTP